MRKLLLPLYLSLPVVSHSAVIADFESDTPGSSPSGWYNGNGWDVATDPTDSGNNVLSTTGRSDNLVSGTGNNATLADGATGVLEFRVYFRSTSTGDINLGLTDVSDLGSISQSNATFFGPLIRLVEGGIMLYDGSGGGGGSFLSADQSVSLNTWYTISMTIDNDVDHWSGTITGGAFGSPTALTSGSSTDFGFRTDAAGDLVNLALRANTNNGFSNGAFIDDITLTAIPEPQTYALIALAGLATLVLRRRR